MIGKDELDRRHTLLGESHQVCCDLCGIEPVDLKGGMLLHIGRTTPPEASPGNRISGTWMICGECHDKWLRTARHKVTCPYCGYNAEEIPMPDEHDREAGEFFFHAIIKSGKGHRIADTDATAEWRKLSEDTRRCFGHAAEAFKKRYVCAG